jgi:predicted transcriptional regulator
MKLGALEELVLLAVGSLDKDAYGVSIKETLAEKTGKSPSIGALHSALYRLEDKGCLTFSEGGSTRERRTQEKVLPANSLRQKDTGRSKRAAAFVCPAYSRIKLNPDQQ